MDGETEQAMSDKIKTLSAAIRLGATFRPQCYGSMFEHGKSCALGAAAEALGIPTHSSREFIDGIRPRFGEPIPVTCPMGGCSFHWNHEEVAVHLNDDHMWTREQIADWLEGQGR
jgi:hypothetical protein